MAWDSNRNNFDRNLAVVIGIDRYKNHPAIRNLSTAESDARAIADLLEKGYAYKPSEVLQLFNEEATLAGIRDLLHRRLPEDLKPGEGDRLIVYFAGHGLPRSNEEGPEGYLVPHDANPTEPESFLPMREISETFNKLDCHHLLIILDCCFAGTFRWAGNRKAIPILETIHREHYDHFIRYPAWHVITSSAHDQEALDVARLKEDNRQSVPGLNEPHSPFALALLEGLQPGDDPQRVKADLFPDGVVTAHELFVYLQNRVKELSGKQQAPGIYPLQRDYDRGEFVFTPLDFDPQKLAEALPLNEENNPYRGLKPFDEKHARFFFGRQVLIEELAKRLSESNQALTVVLGVSGSGKSSLVKAGLIPYLRNQNTEQETEQWRILDPMRPGELPFSSLARILLPIADENLLEQLAEVSFLDDTFQSMLEPKTESNKADSDKKKNNFAVMQSAQKIDEVLLKVADRWCSATLEAKLLLIEDYFAQLEQLDNTQQQEHLKNLHDRILATLDSINKNLQQDLHWFSQLITTWSQNHPGARLLLVIDQFEELLTSSQDDRTSPDQTKEQADRSTEQKEWQKFLEVLRIAIAEHPQTLRLVATLRSDFEPRFLSSALESYWKEARYPVRAMTSDELRQAIENPALKQALYFEELKDSKGNLIGNLVSKLVDEVGQMPGALPLLSFTLSELYVSLYKRWQADPKNTDRTLRFADYEALGGVAGALTRRATAEYDALDEKHQATMRRIMLRMVVIEGEGVARRRVSMSELQYSSNEENERVKAIIERLINARLAVKGQEAAASYVEPAHDFLVRGWDQLQTWIKQNQTDLALQQRLTPATNDWNKNDRDTEYLWMRDPRLALLEKVLESDINNWMNQLELEFVEASKRKRLDELEEAEDRKNKALRSQSLFLADLARQKNQEGSFATGILLSLEALPPEIPDPPEKPNRPYVGEAEAQLYNAIIKLPRQSILAGHNDPVKYADFSRDGQYVVTASDDCTARAWDLKHRKFRRLTGHKRSIHYATFSPDARLIVTASEDTTARLWNVLTGECKAVLGHQATVNHATFSPDGQLVVTVAGTYYDTKDDTARIWDVNSGEQIAVLKHDKDDLRFGVFYAAFSPDGRFIVTASYSGSGSFARVWEVNSGRQITEIPGHLSHPVLRAIFSNDGQHILTTDGVRSASLWEVDSGNFVQFEGHQDDVNSAVLSHDNKRVLTASSDATARLWDISSGQQPIVLEGHESGVNYAAFSPNDQHVLTASDDGTARLWDANNGRPIVVLEGHASRVNHAVFSVDGQCVVTASDDGTARLWNISRGKNIWNGNKGKTSIAPDGRKKVIVLEGHKDWVMCTAFSPDGKRIVTASRSGSSPDGTAYLWDLNSSESTLLQEHTAYYATFSPDGKYVVTASQDGTARLWDLNSGGFRVLSGEERHMTFASFSTNGEWLITVGGGCGSIFAEGYDLPTAARLWEVSSGKLLKVFQGHEKEILHAAFSPSNQWLVTASFDGNVILWKVNTGTVKTVLRGQGGPTSYATFSPDGQLLLTASFTKDAMYHDPADYTAYLWDINTGKIKAKLSGHKHYLNCATFSPDSHLVLTASADKTACLWDAHTGEVKTVLEGHQEAVNYAAFSPNGLTVVTASSDGTARLWKTATGQNFALLEGHGKEISAAIGFASGAINHVAFSPTGNLIATASNDGTARLWPIFAKTNDLIDYAREIVSPKQLTPEERKRFFLTE